MQFLTWATHIEKKISWSAFPFFSLCKSSHFTLSTRFIGITQCLRLVTQLLTMFWIACKFPAHCVGRIRPKQFYDCFFNALSGLEKPLFFNDGKHFDFVKPRSFAHQSKRTQGILTTFTTPTSLVRLLHSTNSKLLSSVITSESHPRGWKGTWRCTRCLAEALYRKQGLYRAGFTWWKGFFLPATRLRLRERNRHLADTGKLSCSFLTRECAHAQNEL